jgi:hypothetical protein
MVAQKCRTLYLGYLEYEKKEKSKGKKKKINSCVDFNIS